MQRLNLGTLIIIIAALVIFTGAAYLAGVASASTGSHDSWSLSNLASIRSEGKSNLVNRALRMLKNDYFMEINEETELQLLYGAVDGMTRVFQDEPFNDNFTHFYDPELFQNLQDQTTGEYAGVGILMGVTDDGMYPELITVFPDTPAEESGLEAADIITEVDGEDAFGMILPEVATRIKGEVGTNVKLAYYRPSTGQFADVEMTRRDVKYATVSDMELFDGNVGFIRISSFTEQTGEDFRSAVDDLLSQGMESLVIDLRNNTGGLFRGPLEIADMFIREGAIVKIESRGEIVQVEYANPDSPKYDLPLVVLINGQSASSSEILVGALKDHELCKVVGETSYGKGVIQAVNPMEYNWEDKTDEDGGSYREQEINSALALTIGKYFTPDDNDIHQIGIEPHIWFDLENRLLSEPELASLFADIEIKLDELLELRTQANHIIREYDAVRARSVDIARQLMSGADIPDEPQIIQEEDEHSPIMSIGSVGSTSVVPQVEVEE